MYCHKCKRNWNKGGFCPLCGEKLDEKDNTRSEIEKSRLRKKRIFFLPAAFVINNCNSCSKG